MNKNSYPLLALFVFLSACSSTRSLTRADNGWTGIVAGRPAELVVRDAVLASDKDLQGQQLYQTRYLSAPDGNGGGYIAMVSAYGGEKSYGAPNTWLYRIKGNQVIRQFRFPFAATSLDPKANPPIKGEYWAYECLMCDSPESGYMAKIPVKVFTSGKDWRIAPDLAGRERDRWSREAHLVVQQGLQKYGAEDPEGRRMMQQIDGMFRTKRAAAPKNRTDRVTQEPQKTNQTNL